jgi:Plasmid pRiA4b ORF-3-like protein
VERVQRRPRIAGGVAGYAEFVQAMADADHPEHDNLVEWIGTDTWDPAAFDSIEINDRIAEIKL